MTNIAAAIETLSANGLALMTAIGEQRFTFFDGGIEEGEGSWANCISEEAVGMEITKSVRSTAGILVRLVKIGMFTTAENEDNVNGEGQWYSLTELGAAVANELAGNEAHATVEAIEQAIEAGEEAATAEDEAPAAAKPLTRKAILARFAELGYTGPTSYLLPELRARLVAAEAGVEFTK